jgi:hypothetical protein
MKTLSLVRYIAGCVIILSSLPGCLPYGGGYGPVTTYTYTINNPATVDSATVFTNENAPFRMIAPGSHAPLLSQKGQVNVDIDFGNVISGALAVAISDKDALLFSAGAGFRSSELDQSVYIDMILVTDPPSGPNTVSDVSGNYAYTINNDCESYYFDAAYGRYKVIKNKLRNEWFLGVGYGATENSYNIDFDRASVGNLPGHTFENRYVDNRKYLSFFIQDDIGWVTDYVELVAIARMSSYYYTSRTTSMSGQDETPEYSDLVFAFEPGIRFAFGGKKFRFYAQVNTVLPVETSGVEWYDEPQFRGGMLFRIGDVIKTPVP